MDNEQFYYWIQKTDYTTEEEELSGLEEALAIYRDTDWATLVADYDEDDGEKNCPPGIGFHNGFDEGNRDAGLLHICPYDDKTVYFNFNYPVDRKFLWLFTVKGLEFYERDNLPVDRVEELIRLFFTGDYEAILKI